MKRWSCRKFFFTLTELLIAIAIVGLLAGLIMGAVHRAGGQGRSAACRSNLRQIGLALTVYLDGHRRFPLISNLPALGLTPHPGAAQALAPQLSGSTEVFGCPADDQGYYEEQGTSYEWNAYLNGQPAQGLQIFGHPVKASEMRVFWDMEPFHGTLGSPRARNLLMLDTVVRDL